MKTTTKVKQWGNSLALRLPKSFTDATGIASNSEVEIVSDGKSVTITPIAKPKLKTLEELLEGVTPAMIGGELDWGPDVGRERWYDQG